MDTAYHLEQANERVTPFMNILNYPKDRDMSFDALRGIAIVAVVAMHAIPWQAYHNYVVLSYRQLLNFAVPLFLFISGYWLEKKPINSLTDYEMFLTRRLSRILIPYLFWSLVYLGYETIKGCDISVYDALFKLLTGGASVQFWFIILIAQLYICTPLLQYLNCRRYGIVLVTLLNIIYLLVQYPLCLHGLWFIRFHVPFLSFVVFYQAGFWMSSRYDKTPLPQNIRFVILPAILLSALISIQEALMILSYHDNWHMAISPLKYSSFLYFTCIILGLMLLREHFRNWPKFLVVLGNYSFGIYLIHMIVLRGITKVINKIGESCPSGALYQIIIVLMTLSICFAIIGLTRKLLPKPFCSKVLGF